MLKNWFYLLVLIALVQNATAQSTDEIGIRKLLSNQTAAWNTGNIDSFMTTYWHSDSLMFIGKSGITYGWQKTMNNYKKNYPDTITMGKLNFELLQLKRLSAGYYFVVGKWHLVRSVGDIGGIFTLIFRKIKNNWVIVADHTS